MEIDSLDKIEIESLDKFISRIKEIEQCEEGYVRFYRGQPVNEPLRPNVFRRQCFIDNESEIYNEITNKKPEEFSNSKCSFDYLVKMQHYYIPTRLLDITTNPLVALYFACCEAPMVLPDKYKPTVYCIDIPMGLIKNYNSDSVTILSSLARYDDCSKRILIAYIYNLNKIRDVLLNSFKKLGLNGLTEMNRNKQNGVVNSNLYAEIKNGFKLYENYEIQNIPNDSQIEEILNDLLNFYIEIPENEWSEEETYIYYALSVINNKYWHIDDMRLLHEIKQDKPYFQDLMHIDTFNTIYCVKPRLDNPRIIKQNGAFLIFPHAQAKLKNPMKITEISIDKLKASSIVDELSIVDVNKESLFNDMDTVSLAIKGKYEKTK